MIQQSFKLILLDLLHQAQNSQNAFFQELAPDELTTIGTTDCWSARDHVAHMTFWRRRLVLRLQAILQNVSQPQYEDFEQLNPIIFEENRYRSWSEILAESDSVYAALFATTEQLTEEDLTAFNRFDWTGDGTPLYTAFMGNCYEHTQNHLAQYSLDRGDLEPALNTYEVWAKRVLDAGVPEILQGYVFYNLACFYATHNRLEKASTPLQQAFKLFPQSREFALTDPDLVELHLNQTE